MYATKRIHFLGPTDPLRNRTVGKFPKKFLFGLGLGNSGSELAKIKISQIL
jgi:hypothetical protein